MAHFSVDHDIKKLVVVSNDFLLRQLDRDGPKIRKSFDRLAKVDLIETSKLLGQTAGLLNPHLRRLADNDIKAVSARLLANAISSFIASVEVARHGFRRQYGSSARPVVEALTTILYLQIEIGALDRFLEGKLESTKTVTHAKRVLPPIGYLYGLLSNEFVHIGPNHAKLEPVVAYEADEEALKFIGSILRATAWLIYVIAELVFHDDIADHRYWRAHGNGHYEYAPSETEFAWLKDFFERHAGL